MDPLKKQELIRIARHLNGQIEELERLENDIHRPKRYQKIARNRRTHLSFRRNQIVARLAEEGFGPEGLAS